MTMDLFTAMQQLNAINGGNTTDNSVNQNVNQSTGFGTVEPQPFNPQGGGNSVAPQPFNPQGGGNSVAPQPFAPQAGANNVEPQPFAPQAIWTNELTQAFNPQTVGDVEQPSSTSTAFNPVNSLNTENTNNAATIGFAPEAQQLNNQAIVEAEATAGTVNKTETTSKKATSKKSTSKKSKGKDNKDSVYVYERDIEMPVKYGGIERFKMPLKLELHGMDEFEYIKNKLAEIGVSAAKMENFVVEEQDEHFRLIKVAREQTRYHSKG